MTQTIDPPASHTDELESFLKTGIAAQQAVDALLANMFGSLKLKPTTGQLARFTAQLAEAERSEQRANELQGEINSLRARAKTLRKNAPKILREIEQLDLYPPAAAAPVEITINTRDENGVKQPLDPDVAQAVGQAAMAIHEKISAEQQSAGEEHLGLDPEPAMLAAGNEPNDTRPPATMTVKKDELCEILHGAPPRAQKASARLMPGEVVKAGDFGLSYVELERMMKLTSVTQPHGTQLDPDVVWDSEIADPVRLDDRYWALVICSVTSERYRYEFQPVRKAPPPGDDLPGMAWGDRRDLFPKLAPEDISLDGIRAMTQDDNWWIFEGDNSARITVVVPRASAEFDDAADQEERKCRICGCTEDDCSQCVEKTGSPCSWVGSNLCSACAPIPEKPAGQSMSWHQWAQAVQAAADHRRIDMGEGVEPLSYWLFCYEDGYKPVEAVEEYADDAARDEKSEPQEKSPRQETIDDLNDDQKKLMAPEVNDAGVYFKPGIFHITPLPVRCNIQIFVAESSIDGQFRTGQEIAILDVMTAGEMPSVRKIGYSSPEYAVRTEAQRILAILKSKQDHTRDSKQKARIKSCVHSVEEFIAHSPLARVRTNAAESLPNRQPAAAPARSDDDEFSKPPKGEDGYAMGLTPAAVEGLNYCSSLAYCTTREQREKFNKKPPTIKPITLNGRPYICEGSCWGPYRKWETHDLRPLYTEEQFKIGFPEPLHTTDDGYLGLRVKVGKTLYVIGPRGEERKIRFVYPKPAAKSESKPKPAAGVPKQTFNQWLASLRASLNGQGQNKLIDRVEPDDTHLKYMYENGDTPRNGAAHVIETANKKGAKKR